MCFSVLQLCALCLVVVTAAARDDSGGFVGVLDDGNLHITAPDQGRVLINGVDPVASLDTITWALLQATRDTTFCSCQTTVRPHHPCVQHQVCDLTHDGGKWTLVAVSSDDGQETWTWNNRHLWDTDTTTFGSVDQLHRDFKSPAMHTLAFRDLLFVHSPSGTWASYRNVSNATIPLAAFVGHQPVQCFRTLGTGFKLSAGSSNIKALNESQRNNGGYGLCDTDLYFNAKDVEGKSMVCGANNDAYGPSWSRGNSVAGPLHGCPQDDPAIAGLGPCNGWPDKENCGYVGGSGFAEPLKLNDASRGTGRNHMKIYVR